MVWKYITKSEPAPVTGIQQCNSATNYQRGAYKMQSAVKGPRMFGKVIRVKIPEGGINFFGSHKLYFIENFALQL
jgi:hypothetical protein